MNNEQTADQKADTLLLEIIRSQPGILKPSNTSTSEAKMTGEFISALRSHLLEMYRKQS